MEGQDNTGIVFGTTEAARMLGTSDVTVRRYSDALVTLGHEVGRNQRGRRVLTTTDLEIITRAKAMADARPGLTVEAALRAALGVPEAPVELAPALGVGELGVRLLGHLEAQEATMREVASSLAVLPRLEALVRAQAAEIVALRSEVAELRGGQQALPAPVEPEPIPTPAREVTRPAPSILARMEAVARDLLGGRRR